MRWLTLIFALAFWRFGPNLAENVGPAPSLHSISAGSNAEAILEKALRDFRSKITSNLKNESEQQPREMVGNDVRNSHIPAESSAVQQRQQPTTMEPFAETSASNSLEIDGGGGGEAMNFVVRANEKTSSPDAKFEFLPHFEKEYYEMMVPEGVNHEKSAMAIVHFIGGVKSDFPQFTIQNDPLGLFEVGTVNTVQSPNHIVCSVPIVLRAGAFVDASQIHGDAYAFKIIALQSGRVSEAKLKGEILKFSKRIQPSATTTDTGAAAAAVGASTRGVKTVDELDARSTTSATDVMSVTFSMEAENVDLLLGSGSLATRSVTMLIGDDSERGASKKRVESGNSDNINLPTQPMSDAGSVAAVLTESTSGFNVFEAPKTQSNSFEVTALPDEFTVSVTATSSASTNAAMPQEFSDEVSLVDPLLLDDENATLTSANNFALNSIKSDAGRTESGADKESAEQFVSAQVETTMTTKSSDSMNRGQIGVAHGRIEQAASAHVDDSQEANAPRESISSKAKAQPELVADTKAAELLDLQAEFVQDRAPQNFTSLGVKIELAGVENSRVKIPARLSEIEEIDDVSAQITPTDAANKIPNEVFEVQISPPGVLDVKPRFALPGQRIAIIVIDPSAFEGGSDDKSLKFTLECTFASAALRLQQPAGLVASREFIAISTATEAKSHDDIGQEESALDFEQPYYDFRVDENAKNREKVGEIFVRGSNDGGNNPHAKYELRGIGANNFKISEKGEVTVACEDESEECLDYETAELYNLVVIATVEQASVGAPVTIRVSDANDNAPTLKLFDDEIRVLNDEITSPFFVYINDADATAENRRENTLELDGSAADFLVMEKLSDELWQAKLSASATAGIYTLIVTVRDNAATAASRANRTTVDGTRVGAANDAMTTVQVNVIVKGDSPKFRFAKSVYKRTVTYEQLNKGNPLVQLELKGASSSTMVNYVIVDGNPGWMAIEGYGGNVYVGDVPKHHIKGGQYAVTIAAVEQDTQKILAKCQVLITVIASKQDEFLFRKPFYSIIASKDESRAINAKTFPIDENFSNDAKPRIVDESIRAFDENSNAVRLPRELAISLNEKNEVVLSGMAEADETWRSVQQIFFQIQNAENERDIALVALSLSSQVKRALEKLREISRPKFMAPWLNETTPIKIKIPEEFPQNHVLLRLPAYNPLNGRPISSFTLSGDAAHYFRVNPATSTIEIEERIDFENLTPAEQKKLAFEVRAYNDAVDDAIFDELCVAHNKKCDTNVGAIAQIEVQIFDVDDTPPHINFTQNATAGAVATTRKIEISENAKAGDVLALISATDPDSKKLKFALTGGSKRTLENFRIQQKGDVHVIVISNDATLDREENERFTFVVSCVDPSGNNDQLELEVILLDENDNRPLFTAQSAESGDIHAYDNWPADVVLAEFRANDRDAGENARISYSVAVDQKASEAYFAIDAVTGVLRTTKPLAGLADNNGRPYSMSVVATDHGTPRFSSSTRVHVHVHDAAQSSDFDDEMLRFIEPAVDFMLELSEDIPVGRKVFVAEARVGRAAAQTAHAAIRYSLKAANQSDADVEANWLRIEKSTGEIFTTAELDYERAKQLTLELAAESAQAENVNATRLLRVRILNVDDHRPRFLQKSTNSSTLTFLWDDSNENESDLPPIGRVVAIDEDEKPFNEIFYYLLPSCSQTSPPFEIDEKAGELRAKKRHNATSATLKSYQVCAFASSSKIAAENLPRYNATRDDHLAVDVVPLSHRIRAENERKLRLERALKNNTIIVLDRTLKAERIPIVLSDSTLKHEEASLFAYNLSRVQFVPWNKAEAIRANDLVGINEEDGMIRVDPIIVDSNNVEGNFLVDIRVTHIKSQKFVGNIRKQVHVLAEESKLRFVVEEKANIFASKIAWLKSRLESALSGVAEKLIVQFTLPEPYAGLDNRSSVCFYLMNHTLPEQRSGERADVFIAYADSLRKLSTLENRELNNIYQIFKIINVEECCQTAAGGEASDPAANGGATFGGTAALESIPRELLFWSCAVGIGILVLVALCGYGYFVTRYREHLRGKMQDEIDAPNNINHNKGFEADGLGPDYAAPFSSFFAPQFLHANNNKTTPASALDY